jgi:hypothetical protein
LQPVSRKGAKARSQPDAAWTPTCSSAMHDIASPQQHHQHATPHLDSTRLDSAHRIASRSHHPHASYPAYAGAWRSSHSTPPWPTLPTHPAYGTTPHQTTPAGVHGRHSYVTRRRRIRDPPVPPRFGYTGRASFAQRRSRRRGRLVPGGAGRLQHVRAL